MRTKPLTIVDAQSHCIRTPEMRQVACTPYVHAGDLDEVHLVRTDAVWSLGTSFLEEQARFFIQKECSRAIYTANGCCS